MNTFYTSESNIQTVLSLMKAHRIKRVVISPGTTNLTFVGSLQSDSWFELYSSVDERSAAYIACGLAAETGEPVALSCTGATASRNYIPGLTEAFYRKLPVLAITSMQHPGRIGSYTPQVIDRSQQLKDMVVYSAQALMPHTEEDEWSLNVELNKAFIALRKNGGGPVHINLMTNYSKDFSAKKLPHQRIIRHIGYHDAKPDISAKRIGVTVGSHIAWCDELKTSVERFCELYNAVVFCEHISNYKGKYSIFPGLILMQEQYVPSCVNIDLEINIGCVEGVGNGTHSKEVWRVNPDGVIRDKSHKTSYIFQMEEVDFFSYYNSITNETRFKSNENHEFYNSCVKECTKLASRIPELPFSNAWIAQKTSYKLPDGCVLHLGILNSVRTWNFFDIPDSVLCYANTGGYGIDGDISSLMGASLAHPDKLYFGVVGDLAFFYDMNVLGNRYFGRNIRLMLINNGRGTEFRNFDHPAARFEEDADPFMAAAGHFGRQSRELVKHYAEDLGFEYLTADSKDSYLKNVDRFLTPEITDRPMLFEVFTDSKDESDALKILYNIETSTKGTAKKLVKDVLGEKGAAALKGFLKK